MISQNTKLKILDQVRVEEVIGDFVQLKRAGANLKGLCPFHDEKTPSFVVSPAKGIYKCFGCGKSGDSISFMMEHDQLSYPEALRYLAEKYGIEVEEEISAEDEQEFKEQKSLKDSMYIAMKFATQYFQQQLMESEEGKTVGMPYFKYRGFNNQTITDFQLGYAPDGYRNLIESAKQAGYSPEILEKSGLIKSKEGKEPYDFFRARVMFPIHNLSGKVVAFGGRIMTKEPNQAKYINTPETEIFTKGKLVYGIYQAKSEIRKQDSCYLVEGYTDVLSFHQVGIENVVASSGTALTKEQIKLIHRFTENIILIYDGDAAGIKAALRGVDLMLEQGMHVKVVLLPEGEDPDSFARAHGTDDTLKYIQDNKKDFIFFKADILLKDTQQDPTLKSQAIHGIVESISLIQDQILRAFYIRECSLLADLPEEMLVSEVNKYSVRRLKLKRQMGNNEAELAQDLVSIPATTPQSERIDIQDEEKAIKIQENDILRILLKFGDKILQEDTTVFDFVKNTIGRNVVFKDPIHQKVFDALFDSYEKGISFDKMVDENTYDDSQIRIFIIDHKISAYQLSPNWEAQHNIIVRNEASTWKRDVHSTIDRYILHRIKEQLIEIDRKIKETDISDFEKWEELIQMKMRLQDPKISIAKKFGTIIL